MPTAHQTGISMVLAQTKRSPTVKAPQRIQPQKKSWRPGAVFMVEDLGLYS